MHELQHLLSVRKQQPAFHPEASQEILSLGDEFFAVRRKAMNEEQEVLAVSNLTEWPQHLCLKALTGLSLDLYSFDLVSGESLKVKDETTILQPYQTVWLNNPTIS